jgi:hypothetical protein
MCPVFKAQKTAVSPWGDIMKKAFLLMTLLVFTVLVFSAVCASAEIKASDYYALVKKLKTTHDVAIDYNTLRTAYTLTPDYQPYGAEVYKTREPAKDALGKNDYKEALRLAESILEKTYVDLDAHLIARLAYRGLNNTLMYGFHTASLEALLTPCTLR